MDSATAYSLNYSYSSDAAKRVIQVDEKAGNTLGQTLKIQYGGDNTTTFTTSGKDDIINTSDDIQTIYTFNNFGQTISLSENANGVLGFYYNNTPYYYLKNLQGDIVGILDANGTQVVSYTYDAWGAPLSVTGTAADTIGQLNPFRYRSYYYDNETGLYYLNSRYYDPQTYRFLNADNAISGTGESIQGYNLFAYCFNNSVNMADSSGHWPQWLKNIASSVKNVVDSTINGIKSVVASISNTLNSSHDANRRPNTGEPGSTYRAPNGDTRTYGPDGNPLHDYDHDDHGNPANHPHDENGGHNHDWDDGVRGPAYSMNWEAAAGLALVTISVVGIVAVAANDATGVGVADDFLFVPLGAGVREGLILIFS